MRTSGRLFGFVAALGVCCGLAWISHTTAEDRSRQKLRRLVPRAQHGKLQAFGSDAELKRYLNELAAVKTALWRAARRRDRLAFPSMELSLQEAPAPEPEAAASDEAGAEESITNTQEQGVDEGGIVKVHGEHLVVLRRGRLFTTRVGQELKPISALDVRPEGETAHSWYDEMLIHDDRIVVIGYSYDLSATELGLFQIDARGGLAYLDTYYLSSSDYYSSRNYASRLVGDELLFYMPYPFLRHDYSDGDGRFEAQLPGYTDRGKQPRDDWNELLSGARVYGPIQRTDDPVMHTLVRCSLARGAFDCQARAVIGPYSRSFYVSRENVYLWVQGEGDAAAAVYRMPLAGGAPTAMRAHGAPIDQFSFKEDPDGHLNVVVRDWGHGDGMWGAEHQGGKLSLLRVPAETFQARATPADRAHYTPLPAPSPAYVVHNRFVGEHLLYGSGQGWGDARHDDGLYVLPYRSSTEITRVPVGHGVDRIEAMGSHAVAVGNRRQDLMFTAVALGGTPRVADRFSQPNARQGETRSHGFFYKPSDAESGTLGMPIRRSGIGADPLQHGSAEVAYLAVDRGSFRPLGTLTASRERRDDRCQVSCSDWYGNARPIFLRGRTYALLGYELVEGRRGPESIEELGRVHMLDAL